MTPRVFETLYAVTVRHGRPLTVNPWQLAAVVAGQLAAPLPDDAEAALAAVVAVLVRIGLVDPSDPVCVSCLGNRAVAPLHETSRGPIIYS